MMFIGGPLHGKPVPQEMAEAGQIACAGVSDQGAQFVAVYLRTPWFVAPDKPLIHYYVIQGGDPEYVIDVVRRMIPLC